MIISGQQLGNARRWLAAHLQNAADNEEIDIAEVSGTVASDIDGAVVEMDALVKLTNAKEGVYAAFINPPKPLSREQFMRAIALIEERLGLTGQPRIILFHVKNGRHHCHIVWSRIDTARERAIQLSHDRQKLRAVARELAGEFDLPLPPGLEKDRGAERFKLPKQPTRAEKAQAKHSGITMEERRAAITDAYRRSDGADSFRDALEQIGYMLARGDSRCFVVVDIAGDVHSLARQVDGAKTKDIKAKLAGLDLSQLPPVERAKILMLQRAAAQQDAARESSKRKADGEAAWQKLQAAQRKRRLEIDLLWQAMKIRHAHEWKVLHAQFLAERERKLARRVWEAWGLALYLKKIAVIRQLIEYYERKKQRSLQEYHAALESGLRRRHENEAAELRRRYDALTRLERRERLTCDEQHAGRADHGITELSGTIVQTYDPQFGQTWQTGGFDRGTTQIVHYAASVAGMKFPENAADITNPFNVTFDRKDGLTPYQFQEGSAHDWSGWLFRDNAAAITQPVSGVFLSAFRMNVADITLSVTHDPANARTGRVTPAVVPRDSHTAF